MKKAATTSFFPLGLPSVTIEDNHTTSAKDKVREEEQGLELGPGVNPAGRGVPAVNVEEEDLRDLVLFEPAHLAQMECEVGREPAIAAGLA